jgi:hypothetical protein
LCISRGVHSLKQQCIDVPVGEFVGEHPEAQLLLFYEVRLFQALNVGV